jgi:hypothetical protein
MWTAMTFSLLASSGPILSSDMGWARKVVWAIVALLAAGVVIGPWLPHVRQSHDEPPGTSGHHGDEGTAELTPPETVE